MSDMNNVQVESTIIKRNSFSSMLKQMKNIREMNIILIIIAVCVIMSFASPYFLTWGNIESIVMQFSTEGIVVIGMTVMLILGGIDISVGSIMCFSMVLPAKIFLAGGNPWISALAGVIACMLIGAINGFFVTKVKLHPFITTLATAAIIRGACYVLTEGSQISLYTLPDSFKYIGVGKLPGGIPFIIVLFFIIVVISDFLLRKTSILRNVFYTGSNEKAARFSGINVNKVKFWVFVLCAGLTGLAGIIFMARFGMATPNFGVGLEMTAIASAVIGGASMSGGKGTVFGSILGICLYYLISSSLILLHVNAYWQEFARGLILLIAISIDSIGEMRKSKRAYKAAA